MLSLYRSLFVRWMSLSLISLIGQLALFFWLLPYIPTTPADYTLFDSFFAPKFLALALAVGLVGALLWTVHQLAKQRSALIAAV